MPTVNVIINGDFDQGSTGWTGTDLETNYTHDVYVVGGTPTNHVAEMDGTAAAVTVMQQSFMIDQAGTYPLSFVSSLRNNWGTVSPGNGEGFTVEILDSDGNAVFSTSVFPSTYTLDPYSFDVTFPSSGNYTLRFTELGANQGAGAIIDNIAIHVPSPICFTSGTILQTENGLKKVDDLQAGDRLLTRDRGYQPIVWITSRSVSAAMLARHPELRPVRIPAGALSHNIPAQDLMISPQHRVLITSQVAERIFGERETLIAAKQLVGVCGIEVVNTCGPVTYWHFLLHQHEVVYANGAPSESLFTGPEALKSISTEQHGEILKIFPDLASRGFQPRPVRPFAKGRKMVNFIRTARASSHMPLIDAQ